MTIQGFVDEISRGRVAGWCFDADRAGTSLTVEVLVNGVLRMRLTADLPRGKMESENGARPGFDGCFDPPLSVFREHLVEVKVAGADEPLPQGSRTLPGRQMDAPRPIVLNSVGRSGSTMVMQEFARHPDIVVADLPPYEIKLLAYYASAFRTLVAEEDRVRSTKPDGMFVEADRFRIGHNPWNRPPYHAITPSGGLTDLFETVIPRRYAEMFRRNVLDYYAVLCADQGKSGAPFFAEKGETYDDARMGARLFFDGVREIVLLRDPRDLYCSAMAFWNVSADEALTMLSTTLPLLERIHREASPDTLFVRYEDLILSPVRTRAAMYGFLGLEPAQADAKRDRALQASHGTSGSDSRSSVGRWRKHLDAEDAEECAEMFRPFMQRFDYRDPPPPRAPSLQIFGGEQARDRVKVTSLDPEAPDSLPLRITNEWRFGAGGNGQACLGAGWAAAGMRSIWSSAAASRLTLPHPGPWPCMLRIVGQPYLGDARLAQQRVRLSVNGAEMGEASLEGFAALECEVFADPAEAADELRIELSFPDAARPCDLHPGDRDQRLLAFALQRISVFAPFRDEAREAGPQPDSAVSGHVVSHVPAPILAPVAALSNPLLQSLGGRG